MIPYTLETRRDTGVSNSTLGFWLFIASEVMLFGALFSAYALLRVSAAEWPSGRTVLNLPLGTINTVVLFGLTTAAWRARAQPLRQASRLMALSTSLALVFLTLKAVEYRGELQAGLTPARNTFLATYYTLTALHAVHVLGGAMANVWSLAGRAGEAMTLSRFRLLSLYWMFVDVVWILIFLLVYVS
jgi:cytochrome c oxidase subunit III